MSRCTSTLRRRRPSRRLFTRRCTLADLTLTQRIAALLATADGLLTDHYGIELGVSAAEPYYSGRTQGYRLYVKAKCARGLSDKIFVYQRLPQVDDQGRPVEAFTNVASPEDLVEYPPDVPAGLDDPFFRLDYVDLIFRNPDLLLDAFAGLLSNVAEMLTSLEGMDHLVAAGTVDFGNPSCSSSSSSSSPSPSSSSTPWPADNSLRIRFSDPCGGGAAYMGQTIRIEGVFKGYLIEEAIGSADMTFALPADQYLVRIEEAHPNSDCQWPTRYPTVLPGIPVTMNYESGPA